MPTAPTPMLIPLRSQQGILEFYKQCSTMMSSAWNIRSHLTRIDKLYQREVDQTIEHKRAQLYNKYGHSGKYQNITVPVVMPAVEAAVTYQTSVFLTGTPLFGVVSDPMWIKPAKQLEAIIDTQAVRGRWTAELMKAFRDGFKYNLGAIEVPWEVETVPQFSSNVQFSPTDAEVKEVAWAGNKINHIDLYNAIFDTRVLPTEISLSGEFAGYTKLLSRIALKAYISKLPNKILSNIRAAFESGTGGAGVDNALTSTYFIPEINKTVLKDVTKSTTTDWLAWVGLANPEQKIKYKNMYELTVLYARILPVDFGLRVKEENTPQIWKFIIVNHQVVIYAERQTNAHNMLPILFFQPLDDGLGYQTKSFTDNVEPIQSLSSALWNSAIASRRRAISDRALYDPSRISEQHINSDNPAAKIPVRPAAYGKPVADAVYAFPFRDDQAGTAIQEAQQLLQFSNTITGQNPVRQGQFVKGNKTQHEFDTVMGNANGRDQATSILLECQLFTPLKFILKSNILQFQTADIIIDRNTGQQLEVHPEQLRKAIMDFKVSDGLVPSDKLMNAESWSVAVQTIGTSPQIGQGYNLAPAFSFLMKSQGADLTPFEKSPQQLAYEQALAAWQQTVGPALEKGASANQLPPQPTPDQFGYTPGQLQSTTQPAAQTQVATRVNNITNNIQNVGE